MGTFVPQQLYMDAKIYGYTRCVKRPWIMFRIKYNSRRRSWL